jgi:rubrerythrin
MSENKTTCNLMAAFAEKSGYQKVYGIMQRMLKKNGKMNAAQMFRRRRLSAAPIPFTLNCIL